VNMFFNPDFHVFRRERWRPISDAHLRDLSSLAQRAPESVFVILEAQPWGWDRSVPSEIGLTLMRCPPITNVLPSILPKKLDGLGGIAEFKTFGIRIADRKRQERNREQPRSGPPYAVTPVFVEELLLTFLDHFLAGDKSRLILVSFGITFELKILASQLRRLRKRLSAWVDLQDIVRQLASGKGGEGVTNPTLCETLRAYDFSDGAHACQGTGTKHNAANDTERASWLLLRLLCLPLDATLDIKRSPSDGHSATNIRRPVLTPAAGPSSNGGRGPAAPKSSPFMAEVSRQFSARTLILPVLHKLVSRYKPVASGIDRRGRSGWVVFSDQETLDRFVQEISGSKSRDGSVWQAFQISEPRVDPPQTLQELREYNRRRREEEAKEERVWGGEGGRDDGTGVDEAVDEDEDFYFMLT
jgi:hypothetical protein